MTPVYQTILPDPASGQRGNAFRACVASLSDLPLALVPPFELMDQAEAGQALVDFLYQHDLEASNWGKNPPPGWSMVSGFYLDAKNRKCPHCVILWDGEYFHNPHPGRQKMKGFYDFHTIGRATGGKENDTDRDAALHNLNHEQEA